MPAVFFVFAIMFAALGIEAGISGHWGRFAFAALFFGIFCAGAIDCINISRGRRP